MSTPSPGIAYIRYATRVYPIRLSKLLVVIDLYGMNPTFTPKVESEIDAFQRGK